MLQFFIFMTLILNTLLFIILNHPLTMGMILMAQTFLISLFTGIFTLMFWFSYSLFLIFMGGMLILFMYMTSLASNETFKFKFKFKFLIFLSLFFILSLNLIWFLDFKSFMFNNKILNLENKSVIDFTKMSLEQNNWMLNKMLNFPTNFITIMLVNYLFLTLIVVVKITNIFKGPLRPKNF